MEGLLVEFSLALFFLCLHPLPGMGHRYYAQRTGSLADDSPLPATASGCPALFVTFRP